MTVVQLLQLLLASSVALNASFVTALICHRLTPGPGRAVGAGATVWVTLMTLYIAAVQAYR